MVRIATEIASPGARRICKKATQRLKKAGQELAKTGPEAGQNWPKAGQKAAKNEPKSDQKVIKNGGWSKSTLKNVHFDHCFNVKNHDFQSSVRGGTRISRFSGILENRSNFGPKLAQNRPETGQKPARNWPKADQKPAKSWPEAGPKVITK